MTFLLRISRGIDRWSTRLGELTGWLCLAMVLIGAYNALVRYLGRFAGWNLSSNAYIEAQWYLFSMVFLLGAAATLRHDQHVRVDVLYGRLGRRGKAWIDVIGTLFMLLPFSLFCLWVSWPAVRNSWHVREVSPDPGGLARYPIKTLILVAFVLLFVQGLSQLIKNVAVLRGMDPDADGVAQEHDLG